MKAIISKICFTLFFLFCLFCNYVVAQIDDCERLKFGYDETGNRIKREWVIEPCLIINHPTFRESGTEQTNDTSNENCSGLIVFPNPVNDNLTVASKTDELIAELYIYDSKGKLIHNVKCRETQINISVLHYKPGMYTLLVYQGNNQHTYRIIKN